MLKLILILAITAYFAYKIGRRVGENKPVEGSRKKRPYDTEVIDAEIVEKDD